LLATTSAETMDEIGVREIGAQVDMQDCVPLRGDGFAQMRR
jgi:hypothetical protein